MAVNVATVAENIFNLLKGYGYEVTSYDDEGKVVYDPATATRFAVSSPNILVRIDETDQTVSLSVHRDADEDELERVREQLKKSVNKYMYTMDYSVFGKRLEPKDSEKIDIEKKRNEMEESLNQLRKLAGLEPLKESDDEMFGGVPEVGDHFRGGTVKKVVGLNDDGFATQREGDIVEYKVIVDSGMGYGGKRDMRQYFFDADGVELSEAKVAIHPITGKKKRFPNSATRDQIMAWKNSTPAPKKKRSFSDMDPSEIDSMPQNTRALGDTAALEKQLQDLSDQQEDYINNWKDYGMSSPEDGYAAAEELQPEMDAIMRKLDQAQGGFGESAEQSMEDEQIAMLKMLLKTAQNDIERRAIQAEIDKWEQHMSESGDEFDDMEFANTSSQRRHPNRDADPLEDFDDSDREIAELILQNREEIGGDDDTIADYLKWKHGINPMATQHVINRLRRMDMMEQDQNLEEDMGIIPDVLMLLLGAFGITGAFAVGMDRLVSFSNKDWIENGLFPSLARKINRMVRGPTEKKALKAVMAAMKADPELDQIVRNGTTMRGFKRGSRQAFLNRMQQLVKDGVVDKQDYMTFRKMADATSNHGRKVALDAKKGKNMEESMELEEGLLNDIYQKIYTATGNLLDNLPVISAKREHKRITAHRNHFMKVMSDEQLEKWRASLRSELKSQHPASQRTFDRRMEVVLRAIEEVKAAENPISYKVALTRLEKLTNDLRKFTAKSNKGYDQRQRAQKKMKKGTPAGVEETRNPFKRLARRGHKASAEIYFDGGQFEIWHDKEGSEYPAMDKDPDGRVYADKTGDPKKLVRYATSAFKPGDKIYVNNFGNKKDPVYLAGVEALIDAGFDVQADGENPKQGELPLDEPKQPTKGQQRFDFGESMMEGQGPHDAEWVDKSERLERKHRLAVKQGDKKKAAKLKKEIQAHYAKESVKEGFGSMYGGAKTSYQPLDDVKIVVKHRKPVNEESRGARSRNIHSIYLQRGEERFKMAENNLKAARAMARHLQQGGEMHDSIGEAIVELAQEHRKLKEFVRYVSKKGLVNETNEEYVQIAKENIADIKHNLEQLSGAKTYARAVESVTDYRNLEILEDDVDLESKFTETHFDDRVAGATQALQRSIAKRNTYRKTIENAIQNETFADLKNALRETEGVIQYATPQAQLSHQVTMLGDAAENSTLRNHLRGISKRLDAGEQMSAFDYQTVKSCLYNANQSRATAESVDTVGQLAEGYKKFLSGFDMY